jgi:DNA-binding NtrC family response regulator
VTRRARRARIGALSSDPALPEPPGPPADPSPAAAWTHQPWRAVRAEALRRVERAYLEALLGQERGRVGATARRAGLSPRSLYQKMRAHGLRKRDFRT